MSAIVGSYREPPAGAFWLSAIRFNVSDIRLRGAQHCVHPRHRLPASKWRDLLSFQVSTSLGREY
jgi:hypothetical protein